MDMGVLCTFPTGVLRFRPHTSFLCITSFLSSEGIEYTSDEAGQFFDFKESTEVQKVLTPSLSWQDVA